MVIFLYELHIFVWIHFLGPSLNLFYPKPCCNESCYKEVTICTGTLIIGTDKGSRPALVAQLDARPTGHQEATGSSCTRSVTFFHGDLIMKYFLRSFSPFR